MNISDLETEVEIMLSALHLSYKKVKSGQYLPEIYLVEDFGIIVSGIEGIDYIQINSKLTLEYKGYKLFYIECDDNILEKKEELIWELMRLGYMRHIRKNYPRQFQSLISNNFGRKIITERLRIWNDQPMYKYLIEENKFALTTTENAVLSRDPAFFDYMP